MTLVIGVDCATEPSKTGLARARFQQGRLLVDEVELCSRRRGPVSVASTWLEEAGSALLALDAPLGWPAPLADELLHHEAGRPLPVTAEDMFNRTTDKYIKQRFGKRPLEVGANLIARTAHAALRFLQELRNTLGVPIPLSWSTAAPTGIVAIEVYPATTKLAHGIAVSGVGLVDLPAWVQVRAGAQSRSPHTRDAILCAIAGGDFLAGRTIGPSNVALAKREGWIWSAPRDAAG